MGARQNARLNCRMKPPHSLWLSFKNSDGQIFGSQLKMVLAFNSGIGSGWQGGDGFLEACSKAVSLCSIE